METRIKEYEKFIKAAAKHPTPELLSYHQDMVKNFQHELAIHLAVTLFFVAITLLAIIGATCSFAFFCNPFDLASPDTASPSDPIAGAAFSITAALLAGLLFIITCFYIKHYYFLENHVQKLYDYAAKIYAALT